MKFGLVVACFFVIDTKRWIVATFAEEIANLVKQGPDKPFLDVWFDNDRTGYVVGAFNFIFRTDDGGATWEPWLERTDNPKRLHLYAMRRIGDGLFIAGEQGLLLKLDPWQKKFVSLKCNYNGTFFGITGKPGALIAYGMRGNAFRSRDNGMSWQKVETGVQGGLMGSAVTEDGRIVLVSQGGHVLVSGDDGASFSQVRIDQPTPAAGVTSLGGNLLALVGQRGVRVQTLK